MFSHPQDSLADPTPLRYSFWSGAMIFPHQLGQSASWNEAFVEEIEVMTVCEMNSTGVNLTF
jgi:beta-glucosidase-like glycosyl hydrolase